LVVIDRQALRRAIAKGPAEGSAAIVTTGWLKQLERELAELDQLRNKHATA